MRALLPAVQSCGAWLIRLLLIGTVLAWAAATPAQEAEEIAAEPDYNAWSTTVRRVEDLLDDSDVVEETLEGLRAELVQQRQVFQEIEGQNRVRIDRVNRQLETLGPPPAEGETEAEGVAARRAELNIELEALQLPGVRATEAYVAADALISEIDTELRDRQAERVLTLWPTPLNPLNWPSVLTEIVQAAVAVPQEMLDNFRRSLNAKVLRDTLPQALILALFGLYMLFRAPYWIDRFDAYLSGVRSGPMNLLLRGVLAILQLGLPIAGLLALLVAIEATGLPGAVGRAALYGLGGFAFSAVVGLWLTRRLFPSGGKGVSPLRLDGRELVRGWLTSRLLVLALATHQGIDAFAEVADIDGLTRGYAVYVVTLIVAYLLFRLVGLFRRSAKRESRSSEASSFSASVIGVLAALAMTICIAGVIVGAAGYLTLAERMVIPAAISLFVFSFIAFLQASFSEFYAAMSRRDRPLEDSLVPTLFGAVLLIGSLPLLALLWGALPTDLAELWSTFLAGFTIGDIRISPSGTLAFLTVFAVGFGLTRLVQGALRTTILPKTRIDLGGRTAIVSGLGYIGVFLAALVAVTTAGIDLSSLAILASALAVGIGFGLQTIVSNFVSGIILLIERPVSEGDWIEVGGQMGYVRRISVRATRIETFDRTDVIVPNADLISGQVTNWTRGNLIGRVIVPVRVAQGSDTRHVEQILMEIAEAQPMVVLAPPPQILFMGFGDSALNFEIRAILRDINFLLNVTSDMNHEIVRRLREEGIVIPFPQQDLWLRNAEALAPAGAAASGPPAPSRIRRPVPLHKPSREPNLALPDGSGGDGDGR